MPGWNWTHHVFNPKNVSVMEIAIDSNRDSARDWDEIPASVSRNLPDALPTALKACLSNPLIIDFETTPDGAVFHIGAVFNGLVFNEDNISNPAPALKRLSKFATSATYILGHNTRPGPGPEPLPGCRNPLFDPH